MKPADFEEKDFEAPLYNQLLAGSSLLATPGQVFEGSFGIDALMHAQHPHFWRIFGHPDVPVGAILPDFRWGWVWRRFGRPRPLPSFAVNLLVQAKRPDTLKGPNPRLAPFGIKKSYWRFKINQKQQVLLGRLSRTLSNRALVVYASVAFDTFDDLYAHTEHNTIVENSVFVRIERMHEHHSWNYDAPGTTGVAMSKPEFIDGKPLFDELESLSQNRNENSPLRELQSLEKLVVSAIYDDNFDDDSFVRYIRNMDEAWTNGYDNYDSPLRYESETKTFAHLQYLFMLLGLDWFVVS